MAYEREQISTLLSRLDERPERLICITGPRQTGKTTMVRQALARIDRPYRYLPVDEPEQQALPDLLGIEDGGFAASDDSVLLDTRVRDTEWIVRQCMQTSLPRWKSGDRPPRCRPRPFWAPGGSNVHDPIRPFDAAWDASGPRSPGDDISRLRAAMRPETRPDLRGARERSCGADVVR